MAQPNPEKIINIANAFYKSQTLFTASDLGVFNKLAELHKATFEQLAAELSLDQRGCRLLLDACAAIGLLNKEDNQYSNSPDASVFLTNGSPADLSKAIRYNRDVYNAWEKTSTFVKSGKPVEKPEIHLGDDPQRTRDFVLSMHGRALGIGRAVVPQLNLEGCGNLLDIGGGPGTYATLIAQHNPQITCTTMDLPAVSAIASELIAEAGMQERVKAIPGDYHTTEFPGNMDAVIFFGVLHQESPDDIVDLFKRANASLNENGKIIIMDMMTDASRIAPEFSSLFALNMALTTENGWVFSDKDAEEWLSQAGFSEFSIKQLPPPMPHWVAEATKCVR